MSLALDCNVIRRLQTQIAEPILALSLSQRRVSDGWQISAYLGPRGPRRFDSGDRAGPHQQLRTGRGDGPRTAHRRRRPARAQGRRRYEQIDLHVQRRVWTADYAA